MKLEEIPRRSHSLSLSLNYPLSLSVLVSIHQFFRAQLSVDLNKLLHQGNHFMSETDRGCMLLCKERKKDNILNQYPNCLGVGEIKRVSRP